jgi:hypothetical protein
MPVRNRQRKRPKASHPYMPGYGLPKGKKGLLPWSWAIQRLEKSHNYWVATTRPDGAPHVMVVWGLWLDGFFIFSTGRQSRKARNLAANPKCVICNELAHEAVVVEGIARRVRKRSRLRKFLIAVRNQIQLGHDSIRKGHTFAEGTGVRGLSSRGVRFEREEIAEQRHALAVRGLAHTVWIPWSNIDICTLPTRENPERTENNEQEISRVRHL